MPLPITRPQQTILDTIERDEGKKIIIDTIKKQLLDSNSVMSGYIKDTIRDELIVTDKTSPIYSDITKYVRDAIEEEIREDDSDIYKAISEKIATDLGAAGESLDGAVTNAIDTALDKDAGTGEYKKIKTAVQVELTTMGFDLTNSLEEMIKAVDDPKYLKDRDMKTYDLTQNTKFKDLVKKYETDFKAYQTKIDTKIDVFDDSIKGLIKKYAALEKGLMTLSKKHLELTKTDKELLAQIMSRTEDLEKDTGKILVKIDAYTKDVIKQYNTVMQGYSGINNVFKQFAQNPNLQPAPTAATVAAKG